MKQQFRPYSLVVSHSVTTASGIELKDTAGSSLFCNYIAVEASGSNPDAYFRVAGNPGNDANQLATPVASLSTAALSLNNMANGAFGGYATVNRGVVEFLLRDKDRMSNITLQLSEAGDTYFFITYGQVSEGSAMRDLERPFGD